MTQSNRADADFGAVRGTFDCDAQLAEVILSRMRLRNWQTGEVMDPQSDARRTGLIIKGRAREVAYGRSGGMALLHQLEPGDLFGEMLVIEENHDSDVCVEAEQPSRSGSLAAQDMVAFIERHGCIAIAVSRQLSKRLVQLRRKIASAVLLSATGRVCAELDRLARASPDLTIRPTPVLTELATKVGTTRETASRVLSSLERRGVFQRTDAGLRLVAPTRLQELIL